MKLTKNQEGFVQSLLNGKNQSDAYRENYSTDNMTDKTIHENASRVRKNSKVSARFDELKAKIEEKIVENSSWTKEKLILEFENIKNKAENIAEFNNCIKSLENIGKLCGFYEDKVKHSGEVVTKINVVPARKRDSK